LVFNGLIFDALSALGWEDKSYPQAGGVKNTPSPGLGCFAAVRPTAYFKPKAFFILLKKRGMRRDARLVGNGQSEACPPHTII